MASRFGGATPSEQTEPNYRSFGRNPSAAPGTATGDLSATVVHAALGQTNEALKILRQLVSAVPQLLHSKGLNRRKSRVDLICKTEVVESRGVQTMPGIEDFVYDQTFRQSFLCQVNS